MTPIPPPILRKWITVVKRTVTHFYTTDFLTCLYLRRHSRKGLLLREFHLYLHQNILLNFFKYLLQCSLPYTVPITTTSPPPPSLGPIHYPQLMDQHQRTQGYMPSRQSMFAKSDQDSNSRQLRLVAVWIWQKLQSGMEIRRSAYALGSLAGKARQFICQPSTWSSCRCTNPSSKCLADPKIQSGRLIN